MTQIFKPRFLKLHVFLTYCVLLCFSLSFGESFYSLEKQGREAYQKQNYDSSIYFWEQAQKKKPQRQDITYNLAHAYYKNKQYSKAIQIYKQNLSHADSLLLPFSHYNLGNSFFKQAETELLQAKNPQTAISSAIQSYTKSIEQYQKSLSLDSLSTSTTKNLKITQKRLKELEEFQKKQEQNKKEEPPPPSKEAKKTLKEALKLVGKQKYATAEKILRDLISKDPSAQKYKTYLQRISEITKLPPAFSYE